MLKSRNLSKIWVSFTALTEKGGVDSESARMPIFPSDEDSDDGFYTHAEQSPSPDSGSFSNTEVTVTDIDRRRVSERPRRRGQRLTVPHARRAGGHSYSSFSPSPLDPSPVNLMSGYMGISVPTTMTDIYEMDEAPQPRRRCQSERQPLLSAKASSTTAAAAAAIPDQRTTITAIVEEVADHVRHTGSNTLA